MGRVFADGLNGVLDLGPHLSGPVFEPVREDPGFFALVSVDDERGAIVGPNGVDLAPETLYQLVREQMLRARLHGEQPP